MAVSSLVEVLTGIDTPRRIALNAARALREDGPRAKDAILALVQALKKKGQDDAIRRNAAWALGEIGPAAREAAAPVLLEIAACGDSSIDLLRAALDALKLIDPKLWPKGDGGEE
jgi:hypothetical protein